MVKARAGKWLSLVPPQLGFSVSIITVLCPRHLLWGCGHLYPCRWMKTSSPLWVSHRPCLSFSSPRTPLHHLSHPRPQLQELMMYVPSFKHWHFAHSLAREGQPLFPKAWPCLLPDEPCLTSLVLIPHAMPYWFCTDRVRSHECCACLGLCVSVFPIEVNRAMSHLFIKRT